jgi:hypothetical protein
VGRVLNPSSDTREADGLRTRPTFDDATTPLHAAPAVPLVRRRVPPLLFWVIILFPVVVLLGSAWFFRARADAEKPTGEITSEQRAIFDAKKRELAAARAAYASGNFHDAVTRYDAYLQKYPGSAVAIAERDAARHKLIVDMPIDDEITVTKPRPKPKEAEPPPKPQPPSRLERIKRWFRGK